MLMVSNGVATDFFQNEGTGAMTDFDFDVQGLGANNLRFRILFGVRHCFTGKSRTEDYENGSKTVLGMYHVQNSIYELVHHCISRTAVNSGLVLGIESDKQSKDQRIKRYKYSILRQ